MLGRVRPIERATRGARESTNLARSLMRGCDRTPHAARQGAHPKN
jgi:hypothetical protein